LENPSEIIPGPNRRAVSELKNSILGCDKQPAEITIDMTTRHTFKMMDLFILNARLES
jgi:hypothetical protein